MQHRGQRPDLKQDDLNRQRQVLGPDHKDNIITHSRTHYQAFSSTHKAAEGLLPSVIKVVLLFAGPR